MAESYPTTPCAKPELAIALLDVIDDGFYVLDEDFRFVHVNRRYCEILERPPGDFVGHRIWDCFPGSRDSEAGRNLYAAVRSGRSASYETYSPVVSRWVWVSVSPVGRGLFAVHGRDITERVRTQNALRESEERFRQVFDQSPLGMATAGPDFLLREVNPALCQMLGYTQQELVGCSFLELVHPDDRPHCQRLGQALISGETSCIHVEERYLQKSGEPLWVSINIGAVHDAQGQLSYTLGILENVDERRRIRAALEESENRLRRLNAQLLQQAEERGRRLASTEARLQAFFELSPDWICLFRGPPDGPFRYVDLNTACLEAYGMTREQVIGHTAEEVLGEQPAQVPIHHFKECLRTGTRQRYLAHRTMAGRTRTIDVMFIPVPEDDPGDERFIISTARDITEREQLEAQLRQAQKMEAVGQLTGGVAHDFNNLLTAVISSLELIGRRAPDERTKRLSTTALKAAMRGAQLTNQLLAFSRRQQLVPAVVDLRSVVADSELLLRRVAGERIDMAIRTAPGLWCAEADAAQFQAAVMNLVVNARDATPDGGRITIALENATVGDRGQTPDLPAGDYVVLCVSDTGAGMAPEILARATEPFFTTKEIGRGSGLGLSMVHGFATQSGGALRIDSQPDEGTTVRLYLPGLPGLQAAPDPELLLDARPAKACRILFVEDSAEVREAGAETLRSLGHTVVLARDGHEALKLLREEDPPDLLLSDVVMPGGMSGLDLAQQVRRLYPNLPILLTSGYAADMPTQANANAFAFIPKPFHPAALARKLRTLLYRSETVP